MGAPSETGQANSPGKVANCSANLAIIQCVLRHSALTHLIDHIYISVGAICGDS